MAFLFRHKTASMVTPADALPGRSEPLAVPATHHVNGHSLVPPFPEGFERSVFALGCFWGAEQVFWNLPGVWVTAAGYSGGFTPNPTYEETCTGRTGHTESVLVISDPSVISYAQLLEAFWEDHDPTQAMRQGNDVGSQYRSAVFTTSDEQAEMVHASKVVFQEKLTAAGYGEITTEIAPEGPWYYAEGYHQQYLAKNPGGYCPVNATGVSCPVGLFNKAGTEATGFDLG
jgi:peptide-methionine (S)-S-oxide reductase